MSRRATASRSDLELLACEVGVLVEPAQVVMVEPGISPRLVVGVLAQLVAPGAAAYLTGQGVAARGVQVPAALIFTAVAIVLLLAVFVTTATLVARRTAGAR